DAGRLLVIGEADHAEATLPGSPKGDLDRVGARHVREIAPPDVVHLVLEPLGVPDGGLPGCKGQSRHAHALATPEAGATPFSRRKEYHPCQQTSFQRLAHPAAAGARVVRSGTLRWTT